MLLSLAACTDDGYETGDGKYSLMRADFAMAHSAASGELDYAVTDDGDSLLLQPRAQAAWATTADSLYRCLLYYKVADGKVEPIVTNAVPVLKVHQVGNDETVSTDPVTFGSAWVGRDGRYLNLDLAVKTGKVDQKDLLQMLGMVCDSTVTDTSGAQHVYLRLFHKQNGVPEYYSSQVYLSLPLGQYAAHTVLHLKVNSYRGMVEKSIRL